VAAAIIRERRERDRQRDSQTQREIGSSIIMHGIETNTTITPYIIYATKGARKRDLPPVHVTLMELVF
jgi:hypothetical protein